MLVPLMAEQNWVRFLSCKAFLRNAEQASAAIFHYNRAFLTIRERQLLYHGQNERVSSAVQIFKYVQVSKL